MKSQTLPQVCKLKGKSVLRSGGHASGRGTIITLWESGDALAKSDQDADQLREQAAEEAGQSIAGVDRYDVAVASS